SRKGVELEMQKNEQKQSDGSCELRLAQLVLRAAQLKAQKELKVLEAAPGAASTACGAAYSKQKKGLRVAQHLLRAAQFK
ncbi:hypothetical protein A2U01_0072644, partial [Trifolium medium]|nr:hypothetical protein [Trifolium medium]